MAWIKKEEEIKTEEEKITKHIKLLRNNSNV